jgi:hypothetical protein
LGEAGFEHYESTTYTDLGDLILILLAGTLSGLHDRLAQDGFETAADLVGDLVEVVDGHLIRLGA